ncbi:Fucose-1-phosphate guanylyltransferase [Nymphon striatum]|nr:Fucose-1-phosphate guanylyltransferase [Nymphon striatum]
MLKTSEGVRRGRGITDSTLTKWVHALTRCVPICDALEQFTGVHTGTSEQHKDMRQSSQSRDNKDRGIFLGWLQVHPPFVGYETDRLVSLSTGIVADTSVNSAMSVQKYQRLHRIVNAEDGLVQVAVNNLDVKTKMKHFPDITQGGITGHEFQQTLKTISEKLASCIGPLWGWKARKDFIHPFWDMVVITTMDEDQKHGYEIQVANKIKDRELPIDVPFHVIADQPGHKIVISGGLEFVNNNFDVWVTNEELHIKSVDTNPNKDVSAILFVYYPDLESIKVEADLREIETSAYSFTKFKEWLDKRGKICDYANISATEFNDLLRKFYAEVKATKQNQSLSPSNGGSTMYCINVLHGIYGSELYTKKVLIIHAGGMSQRLPSVSVPGKVFLPFPIGDPIFQALELVLCIYLPSIRKMRPGFLVSCSDLLITYELDHENSDWYFENPGFTALGHQSPISEGEKHGVYVLDKHPSKLQLESCVFTPECAKVLQKPSIQKMYENGAVIKDEKGSEFVYTDSCFFFDSGVAKDLVAFYKNHSPLKCEIDAYGDFLTALGGRATDDHIENENIILSVTVRLEQIATMELRDQRYYLITECSIQYQFVMKGTKLFVTVAFGIDDDVKKVCST